jgi:hypothetical protein
VIVALAPGQPDFLARAVFLPDELKLRLMTATPSPLVLALLEPRAMVTPAMQVGLLERTRKLKVYFLFR